MAQGKVGKLLVKEGSEVKKGQLLVELDVGDIEIQILDKNQKCKKQKQKCLSSLRMEILLNIKLKKLNIFS